MPSNRDSRRFNPRAFRMSAGTSSPRPPSRGAHRLSRRDGLVFRTFISLPREAKLLESAASASTEAIKSNEEQDSDLDNSYDASSIASLATHLRLTQSMPTISGLLTSVTRDHPHVFPDACRLAKRWLSSHGYPVIMCPFEAEFDGVRHVFHPTTTKSSKSHHPIQSDMSSVSIDLNPLDSGARLSEIALELLLVYASGFSAMIDHKSDSTSGTAQLKPGPLRAGPTGSPLAAFLRFLKLLALHDWEKHPLLVDLNDGFSDLAKRRIACNALQGNRGRLPAMVICTPVDPLGTEWTTIGPTRAGLSTLQALALQSHSLLRAMLVAGARIQDLKAIFRPCHKNLNLLMLLKPDMSRVRALEAVDFLPSTRSLKRRAAHESAPPDEIPPPGAAFWPMGYCYDPMTLFVQLLKFRLGNFFELRWDRHGGSWIGLKWKSNMVTKSVFSKEVLDGLVVHKQCGTQMYVVHQPSSLAALLPHWGQRFVHSVQVINSEIIPEPHSMECDIPKKKQKK
ncbi:unnamed protein product [Dicrocoelium dendriticum]|nr:unnamed protein product [Dicrocoelium dendriticum]